MNCRIMKRFSFFPIPIFLSAFCICFSTNKVLLLLCAVKKRMYAKIEPHRARSVTYAILRICDLCDLIIWQ